MSDAGEWMREVHAQAEYDDAKYISELERECDALSGALRDCIDAIATLDEHAFGWAGDGRSGEVWPIRDELLAKARKALANIEENNEA